MVTQSHRASRGCAPQRCHRLQSNLMPSSQRHVPAGPAINTALSRIERRLRLNGFLSAAMLAVWLLMLVLIAWRALRWLGEALPAASALVILAAVLAGLGLLALLLVKLIARWSTPARAAIEADRRASLKDELTSAHWFLQEPQASEWMTAQLERAARTAGALQPARLIPLRIPGVALGALLAAVLVLLALWTAAPLTPALAMLAAQQSALADAERQQVETMRALMEALPDGDAARRLEAALEVLEAADVTPEQRRQALAQAQDAIQEIRLEAAATRDGLRRLGEMLTAQPGMEAVAEALAKGDAKEAAELLAQMHQATAPLAGETSAPEPAESSPREKTLEQALLEATESPGGAQAPSAEAMQQAVDRLNEIARELEAANFVNEAWQTVRGPQMDVAQRSGLTASRFAQQTTASSTPSPASGETPMGGGTMFRSAAVAEGPGRTEQEGGTRAGDAMGDGPPDALLGGSDERLEAQLKQAGITGEEQEGEDESSTWFYVESQQQKAFTSTRNVEARARFAAAEAGANRGISIQHRQIVKDYFMTLREGAR